MTREIFEFSIRVKKAATLSCVCVSWLQLAGVDRSPVSSKGGRDPGLDRGQKLYRV